MLVNCVVYENGKKLAEIAKEDISDYVCRPECFVWVALKDADAAELAEMKEEFGLHELAVEDALLMTEKPDVAQVMGLVTLVMTRYNAIVAEVQRQARSAKP